MKKFIYLCCMMLLSANMMAQIDLNDPNWERVFFDDFSNNSWDTWFEWQITHPEPVGHYISYLSECSSGVTHGYNEHQVYQRENCQLGNGELKLVSVFEGQNNQPLQCGDYDLPSGKTCDSQHHTLFYSSGNIQTKSKFLYGYFEIRCSLPIHKGSFPAFWLYNAGANFYNEIDIFEYSKGWAHDDYNKQFTCGIYCDNTHPAPSDFSDISQGRVNPILPDASPDLTHFHVFACEWLPDRVTWYVDGNVINEYTNYDSIPHHEMTLKVNYAIDNYAVPVQTNLPIWFDGDEMTIDYIKVYQLKANCDTDVVISNLQEFSNYQPSVKKSIRIEPSSEFTAPTSTNIHMRAVESIVIDKGFTLPQGAQITLQTQPCPE